LLDATDKAEHPFLDEIEEGQPASLVALGDGDDQPEVAPDHLVACLQVALLDELGELDLLVGVEQGVPADLVEEQPNEVGVLLVPAGGRDAEVVVDFLVQKSLSAVYGRVVLVPNTRPGT